MCSSDLAGMIALAFSPNAAVFILIMGALGLSYSYQRPGPSATVADVATPDSRGVAVSGFRTATDVGALKSQVTAIQSKVDDVGAQVGDAHNRLSTLDGRVAEASSTLATVTSSVSSVSNQVTKVQELYPDSVKQSFLELKGAVLDVQAIKTHLNLP